MQCKVTAEIHRGVFIRHIGPTGAPKLLCLHGFADSGAMYLPLSDTRLAQAFELIVVDLPGFGASPRNPLVNAIEDYAQWMAELSSAVAPGERVGLIGHSIASAITVAAVAKLEAAPVGLFSIEGNLTAEDAYFSGQAADWDAAAAFKEAFSTEIWRAGAADPDLRRYYGGVVMADADAMWELGKDARRVSANDAVGSAYTALEIPALYYWGAATTPGATQAFIRDHALRALKYDAESHWPTVTSPQATAEAISEFFIESFQRNGVES